MRNFLRSRSSFKTWQLAVYELLLVLFGGVLGATYPDYFKKYAVILLLAFIIGTIFLFKSRYRT